MVEKIKLGSWGELKEDAALIRFEVFVHEQHVAEEAELDDMDASSDHAVAYDQDGVPLATGRLLPDGHIGRMAVRKIARGQGLGSKVLRCLMDLAQKKGMSSVVLSAQVHAIEFYARHGFIVVSDEYLDENIPHRDMRCNF